MATFDEALNEARRRLQAGRLAEAEPIYQQLLAAAPQAAPLWHEAGLLQLQAGRSEAALERLEKAVALDPEQPAFNSNLGVVYRQLGRAEDAVAAFSRAAQAQPSAPLLSNLGLALKDSGRPDEALAVFDRALALRGDYATAHFNRGNLLMEIGRLDEALAAYARAVELDPSDAGAWCKKGVVHFDLAQLDEALACFDRAIAAQPGYAEALRNRGMARLAEQDYVRGWADWEARLDCEGFITGDYRQPRWRGEPLAGRSLLVHAEQGLGDTLHFARLLPLADRLGGPVKFEVQQALEPLLRQSGLGRWLATPAEAAACNLRCPLLSLPGYVLEGGRPYWGGPYLATDPARVERWRPKLEAIEGVRVGIVWAGNPDHPHDRFRSVHLRQFAPLAEVPSVRLISLQKGAPCGQIAELAGQMDVVDLGELDGDGAFLDTAALMQHLQLVVAVDTAVAHLAGGLGVPVWVPLQLSPDWRWTLRGSETPWYPSMRLFRQSRFDDWPPVLDAMADALRAMSR